jgi:ribosomal-protein-alanine N-acetyltransferase
MSLPRLRFATPEDAPAMRAVEVASFSDPWTEAAFRSLLRHPQMHARVAESGGVLLGYCIGWIVGDECELANIAVAPGARRTGLGARLLDDLIAAVEGHGGGTIYLEVREGNAAARALYASRGFEEAGRRRQYYRAPVEDAVVMRRLVDVAGAPPG